VVAQVVVQLHARSIRCAGCMTRGPGPPCWACWESEERAHLARLLAARMAARPFPASSPEPAGSDRLVACVSCGRRGQNTPSLYCKAASLFLLFRVSGLFCR
jgi:hypothetical protein